MIVQCATFSKTLNHRNIEKSVSDIRIRIRFLFEGSFLISVSGCKLTILPDIQPANRIVILSGVNCQLDRSQPESEEESDSQIKKLTGSGSEIWEQERSRSLKK